MPDAVRVRFAPSPTGYLHVGGARTALFNFLYARHHNGVFILRIEDTDRSRFQPEALAEIYDSLRWLGLQWDEGPEVGGSAGPYIQSERLVLYKAAADELLTRGQAYRCFCTSERLDQIRKEQEAAKVARVSGYDRHCRSLDPAESDHRASAGEPFVVRLKVPLDRQVVFIDLIRGEIVTSSNELDDLVLLKTDGFPTYHLANVVDDHHMRISHVLRGEEWISSTPRHVLLYEAFGWHLPVFAHMPVILSPDGGKLSKRKGAASVMDYKRAGYLPDALFNFLALLGWAPGDDREKMTREEMISLFSVEKISPKGAVLDEKKLEWMNGLYMQEQSVDTVLGTVLPLWQAAGLVGPSTDPAYPRTVVTLLKDRSKRITEIVESGRYFFADPKEYDPQAAKKTFTPDSAGLLRAVREKLAAAPVFDHASLESLYREHAESAGVSAGKLIHPTRLALSGVSFGPGLFELMEALGRETALRRIDRAVQWIEAQQSEPTD